MARALEQEIAHRSKCGAATFTYCPSKAKQLEHLITADWHGRHTVSLDGKVVSQMHIEEHFGRSRFGSRQLLDRGIQAAKALIESMHSDEG